MESSREFQLHAPFKGEVVQGNVRVLVLKGGGAGCGVDGEFEVGRCKLLHLEWISNEVLLYSTGNYIQFIGMEHDGRQYEKKNVTYV